MHPAISDPQDPAAPSEASNSALDFPEIRAWIINHLAAKAGVAPTALDPAERFQRLGLNSLGATAMLVELGARLGRTLSPTLVWEHPTPEALARCLAQKKAAPPAAVTAAAKGPTDEEPIALVGIACRFPQAPNPQAFWRLLRDGVDAITEVPAGRWDLDALYDADPAAPGKLCTRWGGFLAQVDAFDAEFFGISPREAVQIDPQQRLGLELAWEALEDARIEPASLRNSQTGVFFGAMWTDYARLSAGIPEAITQHTATGQDLSIVPARISYLLGLNGPSLLVNTACSSSLVAVHLACQSLLRNEASLCLAGGVNLLLSPESTIAMSKFGAMAPDGRSKAFDARANGYVRGEGGGVVVLKRLSKAQADGDRIYCIIRGSAVNNDGYSNGLTAPSPQAQEAVLAAACAAAGVAPSQIAYVEAHGTGTMLGDPIEAGALGAVLGAGRPIERALRIGSVKTNIGHLEAAAGIAGLIKVALSLHKRALPPSLHFERPNPHIPFSELRLRVQTQLSPWEAEAGRLLAGVSSFGFGGTNCHVVLEAQSAEEPSLFLLSAASEAALRAKAEQQAQALSARAEASLQALCVESVRPPLAPLRLSVLVRSKEELSRHLLAFAAGQPLPGLSVGRPQAQRPRVAFVFGGQGSQWHGMGAALLAHEPAARAVLQQCDQAFRAYVSWSLLERLTAGDAAAFEQTDFVQPALFAMQLALAAAWSERGLLPDVVVGQSMGEVAAACIAGALSLADAARIICLRSQLVLRAKGHGGMAVVGMSLAMTSEALVPFAGRLAVAVSSSPEMTVVAGDEAALTELLAGLQPRGVFCRTVRVDYASHSPQMDPLLPELVQALAGIRPQPTRIEFCSTVTAGRLAGESLDAAYWARNLREPVLFAPALQHLIEQSIDVFVELDPHPVLAQAIEQCLTRLGRGGTVVASARRDEAEGATLLEASGRLFVCGAPLASLAESVPSARSRFTPSLVVLSAQSDAALKVQSAQLREHLLARPELSLSDVTYSLATTRSEMSQRVAIVADSRELLLGACAEAAQGKTPAGVMRAAVATAPGKLAFLFSGQGAQVLGMGKGLHAAWPAFRAAFDQCIDLFDRTMDGNRAYCLRDVMWAEPGSPYALCLDQTAYTQPALFALEYALCALWRSFDVEPDLLAGHSIGELTAACVAGVFSLEDATRLCAARARLMQSLPSGGAMVSIMASEAEVAEAVAAHTALVAIAAVNGPQQVVLAGERAAVTALAEAFSGRGIKTHTLPVSHAFHSPLMEPMLAPFRQVAETIHYQHPTIALLSCRSGKLWTAKDCTAEYWVMHARDAVRFAAGAGTLYEQGARRFVEIGPKSTLLGLVRDCLPAAELSLQPSLRSGRDEAQSLLEALGGLWTQGQPVRWPGVFQEGGHPVDLPTYPWQRQRYWLPIVAVHRSGTATDHPLLGTQMVMAGAQAVFELELRLEHHPWLADHQVAGQVLLPGAALAELFWAAAAQDAKAPVQVAGLVLQAPLRLTASGALRVQVVLREPSAQGRTAAIYSQPAGSSAGAPWTLHATARIELEAEAAEPLDFFGLRKRCSASLDVTAFYARLADAGLLYGHAFQGVRALWTGPHEVLAEVTLTREHQGAGYGVHPSLLDAAFQSVLAGQAFNQAAGPLLPFEIDRFAVHRRGAESAWVHVRFAAPQSEGSILADVTLHNAEGAPIAQALGLRLQPAQRAGLAPLEERSKPDCFYRIDWQETPLVETSKAPFEPGAAQLVLVASPRSTAAAELWSQPWGAIRIEPAALARTLEGLSGPVQVVCFWEAAVDELPAEAAQRIAADGLSVAQALAGREQVRLLWVTRSAVAVHGNEPIDVTASTIWGLGRTLMQEQPELGCTLLDLDLTSRPGAVLARELAAGGDESQLAWRGSRRYAARLVRVRSLLSAEESTDLQLQIRTPGTLESLCLTPTERPLLRPGEVLIEVRAAGLNFRDVLTTLGMYPGLAGPLGNECAGVIVERAADVFEFAIGDQVMALAKGTFRRFVAADARLVARIPPGLSFEQAATSPVVFVTAFYALHDLAALKPGERLLVHAAAGGVGMAAVQLARWLGAQVYATASQAKWEDVRALGAECVASSRTLDFVEKFREHSGGGGVDVVLNSLAGAFVDASLSLLSAGGRLLEMGKTDIRDADQVAAAHPGVRYRAFDLWEVSPQRLGEILSTIADAMAAGRLRPLPLRGFPLSAAQDAFRFMAQARHVGKLALVPDRGRFPSQATVLITGGLGALGLHVARHLAQQGAKHLLLTGRRGLDTPGAAAAVAELRAYGADVTVAAVDVSDKDRLRSVLAALPPDRPLRGVVHAAGGLDDGVLLEQTPGRFERVLRPKVSGAWNLHELTKELELEFFILFSSVSGLLGAAGQGSYAAANAFLDALASHRQAAGLAGQSLAWGTWSSSGMAARLDAAQQARLARQGISALSPEEGLALFERARRQKEALLGVVSIDLSQARRSFGARVPTVWQALLPQPSSRPRHTAPEAWTTRLAQTPPERREEILREEVQAAVAKVLSLGAAGSVPLDRPLKELGLDSLMAVELRNTLGQRMGLTLPATLAFDHPTVQALTRRLLQSLVPPEPAPKPVSAAPHPESASEPIAILGIGCRFPGGVKDPESFWQLISQGADAIAEVPKERWDIAAYYDPNPDASGKMTTRWAGLLSDIDRFDPEFFGISPREAASIDPQQRLLLETSWEALEAAGQTPEQLLGSETGVYIGLWSSEYQNLAMAQVESIDAYSLLGTVHSATVGRLSYWYGLKGPNVPVDTACSSSLVAIHLACQALRARECSMALAGGVNVILRPESTVYFSRLRAMSPTGRCHTFSDDADGYVRSEGCGVVVLKRLSDAQRDGDPVLAVIRGSAVNQDGRSNGLTAPNGPSQEAVIRRALAQAGVAPEQVGYVEAHGTGTPLGDPIEVQALDAVLGEGRSPKTPLVLGSVKTNIGHTEGAAGVAGLIKAVLCLQHGVIPKNLHFRTPNPHIPWPTLKVEVATETRPWPVVWDRRIAGVSSFGFSGTNAHVVLEEASPAAEEEPRADTQDLGAAWLLPLSAGSAPALRQRAAELAAWLRRQPPPELRDIVYTASVRRHHHEHRLAAVGTDIESLSSTLADFARGAPPPDLLAGCSTAEPPPLVFVFSGQGAQWAGMGQELYVQEPHFREVLDTCDAALRKEAGFSVREEMWRPPECSQLDDTAVAQPCLFAIEVALAELLRSWGLRPSAVMGHSVGEIAAACVSGIYDLPQAAKLVTARARAMATAAGSSSRPGKMVAVELPHEQAQQALAGYAPGYEDRVGIAAINGPASVVLSGEAAAIDAVVAHLTSHGVECRELRVRYAFHSPQMDDAARELVHMLDGLSPRPATVPMFSTTTGRAVHGQELDAAYFGANIRQTVRLTDAVAAAWARGGRLFVEVGPHPVLTAELGKTLAAYGSEGQAVMTLRRKRDERAQLLTAVGAAYVQGHAVEWSALRRKGARLVPLPTYPWQRQRHWIAAAATSSNAPGPAAAASDGVPHPLLGAPFRSAAHPHERIYEQRICSATLPYLADHRIGLSLDTDEQTRSEVVFPGAAYLEMALAAATGLGAVTVLEDVRFEQMLVLPPNEKESRTLHLVLNESDSPRPTFQIASFDPAAETWLIHARGSLHGMNADEAAAPWLQAPSQLAAVLGPSLSAAEHYQRMREHGLDYGPAFQGIHELWPGAQQALACVQAGEPASDPRYRLPPTLLDACMQAVYGVLPAEDGDGTYVPVRVARLCYYTRPSQQLWAVVRRRPAAGASAGAQICDLYLTGEQGQLFASLEGLCVQRLQQNLPARPDPLDGCGLSVSWQPLKILGQPQLSSPGRWLLLADRGTRATALAQSLAARGQQPIMVTLGNAYARQAAARFCIDVRKPADYRRLLDDAMGPDGLCQGVVHLGALDAAALDQKTPTQLEADILHAVLSATYMAQAVLQHGFRDPPRLFLITRGAQAAPGSQRLAVAQSPLIGLGRTLAIEHPELRCTSIDLDPDGTDLPGQDLAATNLDAEAEQVVHELGSASEEDAIALRGAARYAARLLPAPLGDNASEPPLPAITEPAAGRPFRLEIQRTGSMDQLALHPVEPPRPGPGEVLIEVEAAGINFRDVLLALGAVPDDGPGADGASPRLGNEAAGTVAAVGEGVQSLHPGDRVLALGARAFGALLVARQELAVPLPAGLSFAEAATLPLVFLTAYYALDQIAHLQPGERVLIHAGAGGVGLAAIQWAQHRRAEIFATAGSEEKRSYLRSLGVEHVFDSRSLRFVDQIRERTAGQGVDVVLNSLSGEFISASLSLLRDFGRFVEIGVKDYYADRPLGTRPFLRNLTFSLLDLRALLAADPRRAGELLRQVVALFASGALRPLPVRTFPVSQAADAFRYMAQAKHIGKLALTMKDPNAQLVPQARASTAQIRPDRCYLITGGLGGLGRVLARWLVEHGARHLLLVGRHAPSVSADAELAALHSAGARVQVVEADVATRDGTAKIAAAIADANAPLGGIAHAAGVVCDRTLLSLSEDDFRQVLRPKVLGAHALHQLSRQHELDFFLLYSSATALVGSPGQANYAAANAFLDALAQERRQQGLPALSIAWGPFSEVGMAAAAENRAVRLQHRGLLSLHPKEGLRALERLLAGPRAAIGVLRFDAQQWIEFYPRAAALPYFSALPRGAKATATGAAVTSPIRQALDSAHPASRPAILQAHLREQVGRVMRLDASQINPRASLLSLGMDSLLSLELRNSLEISLSIRLSGTTLLTYGTLAALGSHLLDALGLAVASEKSEVETLQSPSSEALRHIETELTELSEEEILARLMSKLEHPVSTQVEGDKA